MKLNALKEELGLLVFCIICLFVLKWFMVINEIDIKVNYLLISFFKMFLLVIIIKLFLEKNKLPLQNNILFSIIIFSAVYLSIAQTHQLIKLRGINEIYVLHIIFIFKCFATGFFEEILFRVVLFNAIMKLNFLKGKNAGFESYLTVSAVFAFAHITNVIYFDIYSIINQILLAFGLGMILQLLLAKYNNVVLISSIHSLINYFGMRNSVLLNIEGNVDVLSNIEIFYNMLFFCFLDLVIVIYAYYFLKKV